ncbi:hypothetical protein Maes01_01610 [Microbulbifer aestuariivivens]|uniref:DUF4124 domain-containing protein n=1 Tax=Microbulbifer aestuariivivens TaxID=1908308 RepID=A0ABP9WPB6_9GAMM
MRSALAMIATVTTFTLALVAQADGIYKWVDEDGVVHFGAQPPQAEKQVEVVRKPKSERYRQWESEQMATQASLQGDKQPGDEAKATDTAAQQQDAQQQAQKKAQEEAEQLAKAEKALKAQRCRMARSNLESLTSRNRVREVGADGNQRVVPEDERQARIANARKAIADNC